MNTDIKIYRIAKWVAYGLLTAFLAVFVALCIAVGAKNHKIKEYKQAMTYQTRIMDSLNSRCCDLEGMPVLSVEVQCNIQQKGLVNLQQTTQIARSIAEMTKGEVLAAMDSLQRMNNEN